MIVPMKKVSLIIRENKKDDTLKSPGRERLPPPSPPPWPALRLR